MQYKSVTWAYRIFSDKRPWCLLDFEVYKMRRLLECNAQKREAIILK